MSQKRSQKLQMIREECERNLWVFAQTVEPHRMYGDCHRELYTWVQDNLDGLTEESLSNMLALLPRDHQKSHCAAVTAAWLITRDPAISIIYMSATTTLAEKQLYDIKNIITSKMYTILWPNMVHPEKGKREIWNNTEIAVDHPLRKEKGVRDSTVIAAGLDTTITGLHCKVLVLDDVVVPDNAYTEEGRNKVRRAVSQFASIATTGSKILAVGTRYHPRDIYQDFKEMKREVYDKEGEITGTRRMYAIMERVVEDDGIFLWPREWNADGTDIHGFDWNELAAKKAMYLDKTQFFAQYYNNPNDIEGASITADLFQYYDPSKLTERVGSWFYNGRRLNVYAGIDFAFSLSKSADFTCIVTVGIDCDFNIYILDIDRFKTDKIDTYFRHLLTAHNKWGFKNLRAEVTVAQDVIVEDLKIRAKQEGMMLTIDKHRPNKYQGAKAERIAAALEPRYQNQQVYHARGGFCLMLEEELMLENPAHDDIKDTLAIVLSGDIRKPLNRGELDGGNVSELKYHPRFGGVSY